MIAMAAEPSPPPEGKEIDKNKQAVALTYDKDKDAAPRLTAKGKGFIAQQIIDLAREHDIEIRQDADLVNILSKIDLNTPIPVEAYAAVAEILAYIYKANRAAGRK
jgi:flagellar biosynthesis protein